MVRVLGNFPERIFISDLGDTIYYGQCKDYTDQEFEKSKDLRREIEHGRVIVLDKFKPGYGSLGIGIGTTVDINLIKQAVRDVFSEFTRTISELLSISRQERPVAAREEAVCEQDSLASDVVFVPDVSVGGMISHISVEEKEVGKAEEVDAALSALRKIQNKI